MSDPSAVRGRGVIHLLILTIATIAEVVYYPNIAEAIKEARAARSETFERPMCSQELSGSYWLPAYSYGRLRDPIEHGRQRSSPGYSMRLSSSDHRFGISTQFVRQANTAAKGLLA
jgi:hypothetical protein